MSDDTYPLPPKLAAGLATADSLIRAARRAVEAGRAADLSQLNQLVESICTQARDPHIPEVDRPPVMAALDRLLADLNELEWQVEAARAKARKDDPGRGA